VGLWDLIKLIDLVVYCKWLIKNYDDTNSFAKFANIKRQTV